MPKTSFSTDELIERMADMMRELTPEELADLYNDKFEGNVEYNDGDDTFDQIELN